MTTLGFCVFVNFDVDPAGRVKVNLKHVTSSNMLLSYESKDCTKSNYDVKLSQCMHLGIVLSREQLPSWYKRNGHTNLSSILYVVCSVLRGPHRP